MRAPLPRRFLIAALALPVGAALAFAAFRAQTSPGTAAAAFQLVPAADAQFRGRGAPPLARARPGHSFYFSRAAFNGRRRSWSTDYPKADQQFLTVLRRLTGIDAYPNEHAIRLDDPAIRRFPFLYAVEVGGMSLTQAEVEGLRGYLLAGGFLMVDDFWGSAEWAQFESQMRRVLPEYEIVDVPRDHTLFSTFYQIEEVIQVPNVGQGIAGGPTYERDGYEPHVRGIFDEQGRLLVAINWNTDLGDAWEWAEQPAYPLPYSTYAYQMGANFIVYSMTH